MNLLNSISSALTGLSVEKKNPRGDIRDETEPDVPGMRRETSESDGDDGTSRGPSASILTHMKDVIITGHEAHVREK